MSIAQLVSEFESMYNVNTAVDFPPLHRLNAATNYYYISKYVIIARTWDQIPTDLFYLFLTHEDGWVQTDLNVGHVLLQKLF